MSISINGMDAILNTGTAQVRSAAADSLSGSLDKISSESSEEELKGVIKDFESYFAEQIIKKMKETFTESEDEESTASRYKDYFMDSAIELVADELVDEVGGSLTQQLYEQMKRNYGME